MGLVLIGLAAIVALALAPSVLMLIMGLAFYLVCFVSNACLWVITRILNLRKLKC